MGDVMKQIIKAILITIFITIIGGLVVYIGKSLWNAISKK